MEADSSTFHESRLDITDFVTANLDPSVANFLETYFAQEVKQKQKANERAIAVDRYGKAADNRCFVM